jgi:hypothetical protein
MSGDDPAIHDPGAPEDAQESADTMVTRPAAVSPDSTAHEEPAPVADSPVCDLCGARMLEHHCKLVCPNCGYMRDCSDP